MATEKVSITSSGIFKQKSRWAQSFGEMSESDVVEVLNCDPFRRICGDLESANCSIHLEYLFPYTES